MKKYVYVDREIGKDLYLSKYELFKSFYTDFYNFIKSKNEQDLIDHNINNANDFLKYADYYADGKDNCYSIGFAFHKYFLTSDLNSSLEKQPDSTFIGYIYKQNKYHDFLQFLVNFFAFWRNDEGCTSFDPYNYADNFFASSWASLVDTSKLFYFSAQTVYSWQSFRVKYVLDNIPGTFKTDPYIEEPIISGYEFMGWFDKPEGDKVKVSLKDVDEAYGVLVRKDFYNYWEKEEKTIKKVYVENWKRADPA